MMRSYGVQLDPATIERGVRLCYGAPVSFVRLYNPLSLALSEQVFDRWPVALTTQTIYVRGVGMLVPEHLEDVVTGLHDNIWHVQSFRFDVRPHFVLIGYNGMIDGGDREPFDIPTFLEANPDAAEDARELCRLKRGEIYRAAVHAGYAEIQRLI